MTTRIWAFVYIACGTALLPLSALKAQEPAGPSGGAVDVLARGPVHEAYALPVDKDPQPGPVVPKEPPAAIQELPPDQRPEGDNVEWVPGYWQWDDGGGDFVWVSGLWRAAPPGRQWVPGFYQKVEGGWQWVSGYWKSAAQPEVQVLPPPPPPVDAVPAEPPPTADSVLVPGCWVYRDARYLWRPGYYLDYRPGWVWVPAHYVWTPAGCVFVDGYWDLPLEQRGLLFAPVAFLRPVWREPGFCYTPSYVVSCDFLPTALFVRPRWCHYYFGDYFGDRYARLGFTPWIDYRIGRHAYDPLYGYYRVAHPDRAWARDLAAVYRGRREGGLALPPHTFVEQEALVRRGGGVRNETVLAPLARPGRGGPKLTAVSGPERAQALRDVEHVRNVARQRVEVESRLAASPVRNGDAPRTLKFDVSRPAPARLQATPPPPPAPERAKLPDRRVPGRPEVILRQEPPRHEAPPPPKHDAPPPARHDASPPPVRRDTTPPPPRHEPPAKHEAPPAPRPQAPPQHQAPPPPRHDAPSPPKHDAPPAPVRRDPAPPPAPRHEAPPPPRHDAPPAPRPQTPPPKHDTPPPPPSPHAPPSAKRDAPPAPQRPAAPPPAHQPDQSKKK